MRMIATTPDEDDEDDDDDDGDDNGGGGDGVIMIIILTELMTPGTVVIPRAICIQTSRLNSTDFVATKHGRPYQKHMVNLSQHTYRPNTLNLCFPQNNALLHEIGNLH